VSEDEYNRLLKQFPAKIHAVLSWKKYFERLVQAGRRTGRSDIQIGDDIRKELKGELPDDTIRKYLPSSFKHQEFTNKEAGKFPASTRQLANNNKGTALPLPDIPPMKHEIKEAVKYEEPEGVYMSGKIMTDPPYMEAEREHVKEFEGKNKTDYELTLDCKKFKSELRMALMNNSKLKLLVKDNEVIKIE
jgi:hypothetical protein